MSTKPSVYTKMDILSNSGQVADFRLAVASFDYYEDLLVPSYSAKIKIANAGGGVVDDQDKSVTLYDGLKIRGGERVDVVIQANSGTNEALRLVESPLYVRSVKSLIRQNDKEFFTLHLTSRAAVENEVRFLTKSYSKDAKISDHVKAIIEENFEGSTGSDIDPTGNKYGFLGNQKKPFEILTRLASKAVYGDVGTRSASAGFFFYQTRDGFNFKAIDNLAAQQPVATYFYTDVNKNSVDFEPQGEFRSLDQKIVSFKIIENQDVVNSLKKGTYSTERRFFDPITFDVTDRSNNSFTGSQYINKTPTLGANPFNPEELRLSDSSFSFTNIPSQIITETRNYGTVTPEVEVEETMSIEEIMSQRKMRYNTLFVQRMKITVPLNTNLRAGNTIKLNFPKISTEKAPQYDRGQLSGIYMIRQLCHHYDPMVSYTIMEVLRDTFGRKSSS